MTDALVHAVQPASTDAIAAAWDRLDQLAKPPRSLGRLEELAAQLAGIAGHCPPPLPTHPAVVVAAGDHGVHRQGVSDWPQEVTATMVEVVAGGRAAVNAIARAVGAEVSVLDCGVATGSANGSPWPPDGVHVAGVRRGTRDLTTEPAMTVDECEAAIASGADTARALLAGGTDLLATGDLGIGNTTASACLITALTGADAAEATGRGANPDDGRTPHKVAVVRTALARHGDDRDPLATLASLGGLEHAALVGVMLAGAAARVPVVLDGVIANAAALAAVGLCPASRDYLVAAHTSAEPGAAIALDALGGRGLLDLGMCLGEGTGALLGVPLVQSAARILRDVALLRDVT